MNVLEGNVTEKADGIESIEIRPEVTILSVLRHLNYKPWFAIAEFIDNALQSALSSSVALHALHPEGYKLKVVIQVETAGAGSIVVTDNAAGIASADFPRAFKAAQVPNDRSGLSEFGMGMKSAACWFAENWSVRTKALGESIERTVRFDVGHIVDEKIESLQTEVRQGMSETDHYTVVTLRGLHHLPQGRTLSKIKSHLTSIYRVFLREDRMVLYFNGDRLEYNDPAVLSAKRFVAPGVSESDSPSILWKKDICLDFGKGQRVTGFAALREVGSTPFAGFSLFRRDRLIEGSYDETYRPAYIFKHTNSYPYQRLFGELYIEGFAVSHTKDGFRWEEYEDIFLEYLKDELEQAPLDLLAQAENYRALPARKTLEAKAVKATNNVIEYIENEVSHLIADVAAQPLILAPLPLSIEPAPLQSSERTVTVNDGTWDWVITLRTSADPAREHWLSMAKMESEDGLDDSVRYLTIEISLAHPFSLEFLGSSSENVELFLRLGTAICISLVLSEDVRGDTPEAVLSHFNYLLRGALQKGFAK